MNDRTLVVSPNTFDAPPRRPPSPRRSGWRWLRRLLWLLLALLLGLVVAVGALLWWASRDGSLPRALQLAEQYLPAGMQLHYEGASGSITGGGSVQRLQWAMPGTELDIDGLQLDWRLAELLRRQLHVRALRAERIRVTLTPQPEEPEPPRQPFTMPEKLTLPLQLSLPVQIGRLELQSVAADGSSSVQVLEDIAAQYRYDGQWHALQLDSLRYGDSHAQADVQLHAHDLTLKARIGAWLSGLVPDVPLAMQALLRADGTLAGGDAASIKLTLDAQEVGAQAQAPSAPHALLENFAQALQGLTDPAPTSTQTQTQTQTHTPATDAVAADDAAAGAPAAGVPTAGAVLHADAALHPWRAQPVEQAHLQLAHWNAQAFHASAPATDLHGTVAIEPAFADDGDGDGGEGHADGTRSAAAPATLATAAWQLVAELHNRLPGAWDAQRLPLSRMQAQARYAPERVRIEQAELQLHGTAAAGRITLSGQANPQQPADAQLQLALDTLNLQPLMGGLPETALSGQARLQPLQSDAPARAELARAELALAEWQIDADIRNALTGLVDQGKLPLSQLLAKAQITPERWSAETVQAHVGDGRLDLQGHFEPQTQALELKGQLQQLPLVQIHSELAAEQAPDLSGTLAAIGQLDQGVDFNVDIHSQGTASGGQRSRWNVRAIQTKGRWEPELLDIDTLHLDAFQAKVDSSRLRVALPAADRIEAALSATAPGLVLSANAAMQAASGGGKLGLQVASAEQFIAWLQALPVVGQALPPLQARGAVQLSADWQGGWQQWLEGLQKPAAHPNLRLDLHARSDGLRIELPAAQAAGGSRAAQSTPRARTQTTPTAKTSKTSQSAAAGGATVIAVERLDARVQGNLAAASVALEGDLTANGTRAVLDARAQMAQSNRGGVPVWNLTVEQLGAAATLPQQTQPWRLQLAESLQLTAQIGDTLQLSTSAGAATLTPPQGVAQAGQQLALRWEPIRFSQTAQGATRLQSRGQLSGLVLAWIDGLLPDTPPLKNAGIHSSLVVSGDWDIDMGEALQLQAALRRDSGDLWLGEPPVQAANAGTSTGTRMAVSTAPRTQGVAAGIKTLELRVQSSGEQIQASLDWDTERAGVIKGNAQTRLVRQDGGWTLPDGAPLAGRVQAQMQDLGVWGGLAPLGWRITGALDADVNLGGTVQAPQLQGRIDADGLNLRSVLDGVDLHDGRLRAVLNGNRLDINELVFQGGTGSHAYVRGLSGNRTPAPTARGQMVASGFIDWSGVAHADAQNSGIALDVQTRLEGMQVLVRSDRQVSVSGALSAGLAGGALRVRGDLHVDRASITLPESGAPTLGNDVVVVRRSPSRANTEAAAELPEARGELQTTQPMDMEVKLDLGRDFALQGYGITTRLEGNLTIRNATSGNDPITIIGEIRTDEGRYRAWGQALNVETGTVMFNGPYTNPSLNLLALRPNLPDEINAGVRVTGTALAPRVKLYSQPTMPDAETLSWVVLGRAPGAGGGDGNAMQQAALGLLAGSVGNSLAEGLGFDEVGLSESGVSIGKRLSDQLYITYEAGMAGAASTLYVFYDITRRLTARGQTGETSAVDLIYTISYD